MPPIMSSSTGPLSHKGDSTHHHDQEITPVSLSTINANNAVLPAEPGNSTRRRHPLRVGRSIRTLNTPLA